VSAVTPSALSPAAHRHAHARSLGYRVQLSAAFAEPVRIVRSTSTLRLAHASPRSSATRVCVARTNLALAELECDTAAPLAAIVGLNMRDTSKQRRATSLQERGARSLASSRSWLCEHALAAHGGDVRSARGEFVRRSDRFWLTRTQRTAAAGRGLMTCCSVTRIVHVPISPENGDLRTDRHNACLSGLGIQLSVRFMLRLSRLIGKETPAWQRRSRAAT
jgi:hypothetical protein